MRKPTAVLMPEAAVNKDDLPPARKYEIGFAGQISAVQAVAISHGVNKTANDQFWPRIL